MVEREAQRIEAKPTHPAISRLHADDAATAGRHADRAARSGPERARAEPRRDGRAGAARRAAGNAVERPGVARRRERQEIGRAHVRTPVTIAYPVCRLMLEKKNKTQNNTHEA